MDKEKLLKLLQNDETAGAILNLIKNGAANVQKELSSKATIAQKKLDKEAEKKSSLSESMINRLRARVEKASASKANDYVSSYAQEDTKASASSSSTAEKSEINYDDKLARLRNRLASMQEETPKAKTEEQVNLPQKKQDSDYRLIVERLCPVCEQKTRVVKYKSKLPIISRDLDLCVRYDGINPYLYTVLSCEHCGFAAEEKRFLTKFPNKHQEILKDFLSDGQMAEPFHEERTVKEAASLMEMAVLFSEMTDKSPSRQANLYLKTAWIYRYAEDKENEKINLLKSAELYEKALQTERAYAGNLSANAIMYLLGAMYFLCEEYEKATTNISRIISDSNFRAQDPKLYDKARDLWQDIRAMKKPEVADE